VEGAGLAPGVELDAVGGNSSFGVDEHDVAVRRDDAGVAIVDDLVGEELHSRLVRELHVAAQDQPASVLLDRILARLEPLRRGRRRDGRRLCRRRLRGGDSAPRHETERHERRDTKAHFTAKNQR
jgi:hypothetical protein